MVRFRPQLELQFGDGAQLSQLVRVIEENHRGGGAEADQAGLVDGEAEL